MITDITNINENWVYQSNKFIEASFYLTSNEQKIVRILASMVNKNDVEFKEYSFKISDLAKILNCNEKNACRDIERASDLLMTRFVKIRETNKKDHWESYHIIKTAKCNNGIFTLKIDEEMKGFYLSLQQYTKYQFKNIMEFKHDYSFRFYETLKQYEKLGQRKFSIEELREMLDFGKKQYKFYADFKKRVLIPSVDEINLKTDISIVFEEIKGYRAKVESIKFIIKTRLESNEEIKEEVTSSPDILEDIKQDIKQKFKKLYKGELNINLIHLMIEKKGLERIKEVLNNFKDYIGQSKIEHIEKFFYRCVMDDYTKSNSYIANPSYANFEQREYTDEEWEEFENRYMHTSKTKENTLEKKDNNEFNNLSHDELILKLKELTHKKKI